MTSSLYLQLAATANIPPRDALLLLTPGEVFDIFDLWVKQHGLKRRDD